MRVGIMIGADGSQPTIDGVIDKAKQAEAAGVDNIWLANIFSYDAISTLGIIGRETNRIGLGTAVTPTYPRHPTAIAQQAMTTQAASQGRFTLGIGLSHQIVIEGMLGFSYDKPARHMREYLSVLNPLLAGEMCNFDGEHYNVHNLQLDMPDGKGVDVVVAALGPVMLKVAAELSAGANTWMVGPNTMENHIIAGLRKHGLDTPRIVAGVPMLLTDKPDDVRATLGKQLTIYGQLPSYRGMLDREGLANPEDIAILGNENLLRGEIKRLEDMGVTDLNAAVGGGSPEEYGRTLEFLASLSEA